MENKDIDQLWCDIEEIQKSDLSISDKYSRYYHLLLRVCVILTSSLSAEYNDLFSRLRAVCRLTGYPLYDIEMETGVQINPIIRPKNLWGRYITPFYENVCKEGIIL